MGTLSFSLINIFAASFLFLFAFSDLLYNKFRIQSEYTRKLVHVISGLIALIFPLYFTLLEVGLLCTSFLVILSWSKRKNLLLGINNIGRKTHGSELYPMAIFLSFLIYTLSGNSIFYYLPVSILALADPAAALMGRKFGKSKWSFGDKNKSYLGSIVFFIVAIGCILLYQVIFEINVSLFQLIGIAILATIAELFSKDGSDNITIPLSIILFLIFNNASAW